LYDSYKDGLKTFYFDIRNPNGNRVTLKTLSGVPADVNGIYVDIAALDNGNFVFVWVENSGATGILKARVYSPFGFLYSEQTIYAGNHPLTQPAVEKLAGGGYVFAVAERGTGTVRLGNFTASGLEYFNLATGPASVGEVDISALKDGRYMVQWAELSGDRKIKAQIYDPRQNAVDWTGDDIGQQYAGTKFGDHLRGAGGNDTLFGSAGDDVLNGGDGADRLDGGGGWDLATYIDTPDSVIIDLSDNSNNGGAAAGNVLIGIESLQGTNLGDTLTSVRGADGSGSELHGAGGGDTLKGQNGGDRLYGEAGDDILEGGAGSDVLNGGIGWDLVTYLGTTGQGVTVDLSNNASNAGGALGDTLTDIEVVQGTNQADTLISVDRGGGNGAELHGAGGNDTLIGKGGGDRLFGGDGDDILNGDAGGDVLDGGADSDTAVFSGERSTYTITDNHDGTFTVTGLDGTDRLTNIEWVKFDDGTEALTPGANLNPIINGLSNNTIDEDVSPTGLVGMFSAHDPEDAGVGLVFELKDENGQAADAGGLFQVDPVSGHLTVKANLPDVDGSQDFSITLKVSDRNGSAGSAATYQTFTITVMDVVNGNHAPSTLRLNDATQISITENALFTGTLSAQDADGDTGFTWSFDDSVAGNANSLFEIDNSGTGNKILKLKAGIDYEALPAGQKYVTVYLKADDGKPGGTSATQAFTIAVADLDETPPNQAPTGMTLSGHVADEYVMAGREVGTLSAYDANNDTLSYTLLDDAGGRFMLSGNRILVADGFRLDWEQARSHTIAVQASDGRGGVTSQAFTIDVGNIDPESTGGTARNDVFFGGVKNDVLRGGAGHDRLFGGAGRDTLKGEAGNDTIGGGAGLDKLYGTKGAASRDAFVFDTKLTSKSVANKNKDVIYDFGPKYDSIYLDDAAFGNRTIAKYLKGKGAGLDHACKMKSSFFRVGDKALDRDDFFIARKVKATEYKLYWDADGSGAKAMLEIGTVKLQKGEGTSLTYKDFLFI
jgi:Ca2+-binding RTX toxin-like protein